MGSHVEQSIGSWRKLVKLVGACEEGRERGKGEREGREGRGRKGEEGVREEGVRDERGWSEGRR